MPKSRNKPSQENSHAAQSADAMRRIMRALRTSARRAEARVGVTGAQLFVLQILEESPGLSMNELAERTVTHQSTVSTVVDRLVRRRLVIRSRSAEDGRRVELRLSPRGKALVGRSPEVAQSRLIQGLRSLPEPEGRELARVLRKLVTTMGAAREPAEMFFTEKE
jgi:DNA-binding MarR family transcriptional regulator